MKNLSIFSHFSVLSIRLLVYELGHVVLSPIVTLATPFTLVLLCGDVWIVLQILYTTTPTLSYPWEYIMIRVREIFWPVYMWLVCTQDSEFLRSRSICTNRGFYIHICWVTTSTLVINIFGFSCLIHDLYTYVRCRYPFWPDNDVRYFYLRCCITIHFIQCVCDQKVLPSIVLSLTKTSLTWHLTTHTVLMNTSNKRKIIQILTVHLYHI